MWALGGLAYCILSYFSETGKAKDEYFNENIYADVASEFSLADVSSLVNDPFIIFPYMV